MSAHNLISELSDAVGPTSIGTSQGKCFAWFNGVPTASAAGYAKGCIAINVAASTSSTRLYINSGTNASATWSSFTASA
jgi:hypothetical protein